MATPVIRSVRTLQEPTFGCVDEDTLEPDLSLFDGVNDVAVDCIKAELGASAGDATINERDEPKSGFYAEPGDVDTIPAAAGGLYRRRSGTLTLTYVLEGYGSSDPDVHPVTWALDAGLARAGDSVSTGAEAVTANGSAQTVGVTSAANWVLGGLISTTLAGKRAEFSSVVGKDTENNLIEHSPAFSAELDGDTVRPLRTWTSYHAASLIGPSQAFRLDGHRWRTYAFGCRPSSYKLTATNHRVQLAVEYAVALFVDDHSTVALLGGANVSAPPYRSGGTVMHTLGSEVCITDAIDVDHANYPRIPGRTLPSVTTWEATITNTLDPVGAGVCESVLGQTEWEVVDRSVSVSLMVAPDPEFDGDLYARAKRGVMLGFGPGGAAGSGGCLYLPGGFLTADASKRDLSNPRVHQSLAYAAGGWHGDDGTATAASNTSFRFGLVI